MALTVGTIIQVGFINNLVSTMYTTSHWVYQSLDYKNSAVQPLYEV